MTVTDKPLKFDLAIAHPATALIDAAVLPFTATARTTRNALPTSTSADQGWFWTPSWQAGEAEASAEIEAGAGRRFASGEEFLAALRALSQP